MSGVQQARVFAITQREAENSPDVITGTAHINGKPTRILIDPGATFSFISSNYVMHEKLGISDLNEPVIVSMPIGMCVVCKIVYKDVLVNVSEGEIR